MNSSTPLIKKSLLVLLSAVFFCTSATHAEHKKVRKGATIIYKSNVFELAPAESATAQVKGATLDSVVVTMNGEKILTDLEIEAAPSGEETINSTLTKLINKNSGHFAKLGDGVYAIDIEQVVIGTNGRVLYYKFEGVHPLSKGKMMNKSAQSAANKLIDDYMASDEILFEAGNKGGVRVTCISKSMDAHIRLKVNKGVAILMP